MDTTSTADIQDSFVANSVLSTVSSTSRTNDTTQNAFHEFQNVINSRILFYASKKSDDELNFGASNDPKTAGALELDSYMDTLLDKYVDDKRMHCGMNSRLRLSSTVNRAREKSMEELLKLKLHHYEMNSKEEKVFLESLDEKDDSIELQELLRETFNESILKSRESSETDKKLQESIKRDQIKQKKLEEITRSLLLGVNINYFEDEDSRKIMFKKNV